MRENQFKIIGDNKYEVTLLGGLAARDMLVKLINQYGPAIADLGKSKGDWAPLAAKLSVADVDYLCKSFGKLTQVHLQDGRVIVLDQERLDAHFSGAVFEMFKWLAFCLEANFSDFLSGLAGLNVKPLASVSQSLSPKA